MYVQVQLHSRFIREIHSKAPEWLHITMVINLIYGVSAPTYVSYDLTERYRVKYWHLYNG